MTSRRCYSCSENKKKVLVTVVKTSENCYSDSQNKKKFLLPLPKQVKIARQRSEVRVTVFLKTHFELEHNADNSVF